MVVDESEESRLKKAMASALERNDIRAHVQAETELEPLIIGGADAQMSTANFAAAAAAYLFVKQLNHDLIEVLDQALSNAKNTDADLLEYCRAERQKAEKQIVVMEALGEIATGRSKIMNRQPEAAITNFRHAGSLFALLPDRVLAKHAEAMEHLSEGLERLFRLDNHGAAVAFMRANVQFNNILEEIGPDDARYAGVKQDATSADVMFYRASFREEVARGDFATAVPHGEKLCTLSQRLLTEVPAEAPKWIRYSAEAELHNSLADLATVRAQVLKDQQRWDEAMDNYQQGRAELFKSAEAYLKTDIQGAVAAQELLLNQASGVDVWIRQCERDRELAKRISELEQERARLQDSLLEALKRAGVVVHNTQEAMATVENHAKIVQNVEISVRAALDSLLSVTQNSNLDQRSKSQLAEAIKKTLASGEQGEDFLGKVKSLTGQVADVIRNVGAIAGPLSPWLKVIASMIGIPIPPLPV